MKRKQLRLPIIMATYEYGISEDFSGKVGPVVAVKWRNKQIIRSIPNPSRRLPSEAQLLQREKFRFITEFIKPIQPLLGKYFGQHKGARSRINQAISYHIKHALLGISFPFAIDYSKVMFAIGDLLGLQKLESSFQANTLSLTWLNNNSHSNANEDDELLMVCYKTRSQRFEIMEQVARRDSEYCSVDLNITLGETCYVWIALVSSDKTQVSTSMYLGKFEN